MYLKEKHKWLVLLLVIFSVVLVFFDWTNIKNLGQHIESIRWAPIGVLISEALFITGAALMAISLGQKLPSFKQLAQWPNEYLELRRNIKKLGRQLILSSTFTWGFWLNFIGAIGTSLILMIVLLRVAPYGSVGIISIIVLDLIATFGWRVPVEIARRKAKKASTITVRQATEADLAEYSHLQSQRWLDENKAHNRQLRSRFKTFPEGMLVAEENGRVVGMVFYMRIADYDFKNSPSWYEVTNNGMCDNHVSTGKIIFGVDLTTVRGVGARAGDALLISIAQSAIAHNIKWCMLGGRMPGYHKYQKNMTANQYLWSKNNKGQFLDRQVRYYSKLPGLRIIQELPNYFQDPDSCNYGVLLRWRNPFYEWPLPRLWSSLFPALLKAEETYIWFRRLLLS